MTELKAGDLFALARRHLIDSYDLPEAVEDFTFPAVQSFNWAHDWFDRYSRGRSDVALSGPSSGGGWLEVSYAQLSAASDGVAMKLIEEGAATGDRTVIDMPASVELYAVILGVLKTGGVAIPVHHGLHPEALADRLEVASPHRILTDAAIDDQRTLPAAALVDWNCRNQDLHIASISADAPAFGCFTSGTTGRPKLALHSNRTHGIAHLSSLYWNRLEAGQRHLNVSSPGWAKFFWSSFLVPLTAGATVVVRPEDLGPDSFQEFVETHSVESVCAPVAFLRGCRLTHSPRVRVRDVTSVGEAVPPTLRELVKSTWGVGLREGYGQTEATAILGELATRPGALSVLPGYKVDLARHPGEPAARLTFSALPGGSFLGYLRDDGSISPPQLTDGCQWTGDFATGNPANGSLRILGRGDDVFRSNGHLIAPTELEILLERHHDVSAAAVTAHRSADGDLSPVAFVVLRHKSTPEDVRAWANARLPLEVDLASVTVVDQLPRSINGKVQRSLLARTHQT